MNSKVEFIEAFKKRTKLYAVDSIKLFNALPKNEESRIIGRQFLRSSTSMAANYRACCRARSKAEYFSKLSIAVDEADETLFWLELFVDSEILKENSISHLKREITEILMILSSARKNTYKENNNAR